MSGAPAAAVTAERAPLTVRRLSRAAWRQLAADADTDTDAGDGGSAALLGAIGYGGPPVAEARPPLLHVDAPLLEGGAPRIDAWCGDGSAGPLAHGRCGSVEWRGDGRWLFGSATIDADADGSGPGVEALAERLYRDLFAALDAGGCRHLLRVWNYLPSINADDAGLERYRRFNVGRQRAFDGAGRTCAEKAPAACALGTRHGPLRLAFLGGRDAPLAVENPRQMPAYRYPAAYGPVSPTFSRAALADAGGGRVALFVSGTASVVGHASRHPGDVEAQTRETLANVSAVVAAACGHTSARFEPAALTPTVYVRRAADAGRVRATVEATLDAASAAARSAVYLEADVCRADLDVEIEAHAIAPGMLLDGQGERPMTSHALPRRPWAAAPAGAALLMLAGLAPSAALAADKPLWELGVAVGGLRLPHYRGSDQSRTLILPLPYVVYRGDIFKADRDGARAVLLKTDRLDFDLSLAASPPTNSSDNDARAGMSSLRPTVEIGPNVNYTLARGAGWKLDLRAPLRAAITVESHPRSIGWVAAPNVNLDLRLGDGWQLGLLAGPEYASRRFNGYYYDVPAAQATATRPAYTAPGGAAGGRALVALSRRHADGFMGFFVRYDTLHGAVFADSPLVRRRDNLSFGVAVGWVLTTSGRRVTTDD